jgi:hypothetical protein
MFFYWLFKIESRLRSLEKARCDFDELIEQSAKRSTDGEGAANLEHRTPR